MLALPGFPCSHSPAVTSRNHIYTSLHLYKAQQQNQLTWSGWEPGQEHACTSHSWGNRELSPGETGTHPHSHNKTVPLSTAGAHAARRWALGHAPPRAEGKSAANHPLPTLQGKSPVLLSASTILHLSLPSLGFFN